MTYVTVTALSHDGLLRDHNEDSLVVGPWTLCATATLTPATLAFPLGDPLVVAVADGLGGHPAGEVASTIVVQTLARVGPALADEQAVRAGVDGCAQAVYDEADRDPARAGMGTTVAGLVLTEDSVLVFNVGDSRVYAVREDGLEQLSVDDSPSLSPGQTHTTVVTQTIGGMSGNRSLDPHVAAHPCKPGARYLVCSDGLSDVVPEDEVARLVAESRGAEAAFGLWKAAMEAGGPDNITLALVDVIEEPARR